MFKWSSCSLALHFYLQQFSGYLPYTLQPLIEPNVIFLHHRLIHTYIPFRKFFILFQKQKKVPFFFYFFTWSFLCCAAMAVTQFNPTCSKTHLHSSQLPFLSRTLPRHRHCTIAPLHRTQQARICCSVAPKLVTLLFSECMFGFQLIGSDWISIPFVLLLSEVQVPAVKTSDPKSKPECYGVFCLTYDLRAVSILFPLLCISSMTFCCFSLSWDLNSNCGFCFVHDSVSEWVSSPLLIDSWGFLRGLLGICSRNLFDVAVLMLVKNCMLMHNFLCSM